MTNQQREKRCFYAALSCLGMCSPYALLVALNELEEREKYEECEIIKSIIDVRNSMFDPNGLTRLEFKTEIENKYFSKGSPYYNRALKYIENEHFKTYGTRLFGLPLIENYQGKEVFMNSNDSEEPPF